MVKNNLKNPYANAEFGNPLVKNPHTYIHYFLRSYGSISFSADMGGFAEKFPFSFVFVFTYRKVTDLG